MKNKAISAIEEQFKKECTIIELRYEYPNYTGNERYAIVSSLTQDEIEVRYLEQVSAYTPYIVLKKDFLDIRSDFIRNEDKHKKRLERTSDIYGYVDGESELFHKELVFEDTDTENEKKYTLNRLNEALLSLTEVQRKRIILHFYLGKTEREIALLEGITKTAVHKSLEGSIKKLKKYFKNG